MVKNVACGTHTISCAKWSRPAGIYGKYYMSSPVDIMHIVIQNMFDHIEMFLMSNLSMVCTFVLALIIVFIPVYFVGDVRRFF